LPIDDRRLIRGGRQLRAPRRWERRPDIGAQRSYRWPTPRRGGTCTSLAASRLVAPIMSKKWVMALVWIAVAPLAAAPAFGHNPPKRVDIAVTAARLDALYLRIAGNRQEQRASELINYHRIEGGIYRCMRAAGKSYRIAPFVSRFDDFRNSDLGFGSGRGSVFDSITDRGRVSILNELAGARYARAGVLDWWSWVPAADAATFNRCTAPYQHRMYPDIEPPAGVYELSGFPGLLDTIERDPAVIAVMRPYRSGYDVDERTDFLFAQRISYQDAPIDGRPAKPAWTRGVKEIRAAFDADIDCRMPAYRIAMTLLAPRIDAWQKQHRTDITTIRAAWRLRVAKARHLPSAIPG
jgi:hypothetical protein